MSRTWCGVLVAVAVLLGTLVWPARAATSAPQACPATVGQRYVVLIPGFLSSSLTGSQPGVLDPTNHRVRDAFAAMRAALGEALVPPPRIVYFSYGVARLRAADEPPERAWLGDRYLDESEPRYWSQDTSEYPVDAHAEALGWLVRDLLRCDPEASVDVVGFSLGGVVALRWAATEDDGPDSPLAAIHRIVVVDSPVGGTNPALLAPSLAAAPPSVVAAAGSGAVLSDLLPGSEVIRSLPAALDRVDVASIENSRDFLVNGQPLPGGPVAGPEGWLGRGAAVSFLPPARYPEAYLADMGDAPAGAGGLWEYLVTTHGMVLWDAGAHRRLADLVRDDGPHWRARRESGPSSVPAGAATNGR